MPFIKATLRNILLSKYRKQYKCTIYILLQVLSSVEKRGLYYERGQLCSDLREGHVEMSLFCFALLCVNIRSCSKWFILNPTEKTHQCNILGI